MNKRKTGSEYEKLAACWLEEQGFQILERNFYCRQGEIDLIARDGRYLVFIEVKYRKDGHAGHPAEAVHRYKQKKIARAALYYCHQRGITENQACRFDVVCILDGKVEHIINAFDFI